MSLENALEEERKAIVQILEAAQNHAPVTKSPNRKPHITSSLLLPESPPPPRKSSSSMLLDDDPNSHHLKPVRSSGNSQRSMSVPASLSLRPTRSDASTPRKSLADYDDDGDPFASGESYYYSSKNLRTALSPGPMTKREREEAEKKSAGSLLSFWKRPSTSQTNSALGSRSPSRDRSRSASRSAPTVDMDKLRLSQNTSMLTSSATSSPSLTPKTGNSLVPPNPIDSSSAAPPTRSNDTSYLDSYNLKSVANTINLDKPVASRRPSSNSRRGTNAADEFNELYKSMDTASSRRMVDEEEEYSEDEETGTSSEDDSDSDESRDSDAEGSINNIPPSTTHSGSMISAMEEERKMLESSKFHVKSLIDDALPPGAVPPPSMAEYAAYKRRIIHPATAFDNNIVEDTPYTSDTEELLDARRAAALPFEISTIHSSMPTKRMLRTMSRGENLPSLTDPDAPIPKTFVLGTDLSPEATHALEWTIGTVLRDTNVLYIVCSYEDELANEKQSSTTPSKQEEERLNAMTQLTNIITKLLRKTRLQVHVVIEVVHCKSPKHLLMAVIDHVLPTMVILGSRGRSALKGVLLGSFSNYIVERSAVPVMVARRKLHKTKHKDLNVRLANNLRQQAHGGLSSAIVD